MSENVSNYRQGLLGLLEKVKGMQLAKVQEEEERAPTSEDNDRMEKIFVCIQLRNVLGGLSGERGFFVAYDEWRVAPDREDDRVQWGLDPILMNSSPRKRYTRCQWYQEYSWCERSRIYFCRGFWATSGFVDPSVVRDAAGDVKVLQGWWEINRSHPTWTLRSLPAIPPKVGYQPITRALVLSYVQCFHWTREGQARVRSRWQLKARIPLRRIWQEVGPEGHLLDSTV
ncbi:uncharacterized protein LOC127279902 [Leptopilina boulardi]|uniref:uncharacterized protein LOC127279902 n=1 Tax=Leptopilina boulardi TaxID=63433 RepID=UPI0021F607AC|nr:uncharacterized protein LOC127279902 [Leptopilina boulardi]